MKKLLRPTLLLALISSLLLTSCGNKPAENKTSEEKIKIGIIQLLDHEALDNSREGFIKGLADRGYINEENIIIDYANAQDDQANLKSISEKLVNDKSDLILAIATPAAQSVATVAKGTDIPILITAVSDAVDAKLIDSNEKPGGNITGTSDLTPVKEQLELLVKLFPDVKKVALMYSSKESNSVFQANIAKEVGASLGLEMEDKTIASTNDMAQVAESLVGKFDAIYVPTDNVIASAMPTLTSVTDKHKIPLIVGEEGMCKKGALASVSINYYDLGYVTGEMAADILDGKSKPADMPIRYTENPNLIFNKKTFDILGLEIPEDLKANAIIVK